MALVALTHSKFDCPKYLIYEPPLEYKGLIGLRSSSRRSKNYLSLTSKAWNVIIFISFVEIPRKFARE